MSKVPALIDALVALFSADEVLSQVQVADGPEVTGAKASDWVLVGYDGDANGEFLAASSSFDWSSLSTQRAESVSTTVALVAGRGDTDVRAARNRVFELLARVELIFRQNPTANVPQSRVAITSSRLHQDQTPDGVQARLLLNITCETFN